MRDPQIAGTSRSPPDSISRTNSNVFSPKRKRKIFSRIPLPIDDVELQITDLLRENSTSIIIGETGSGKSTQLPQLCLRAGLGSKGKIGITQPRRVAAVSLATRVSEELGSTLGDKVGYHVRFEKQYTNDSEIIYMTDGMLLRQAMQCVQLSEFSTIIVDEAHERSLHTDILLVVLRVIQRQRESSPHPLKIVIMSATLQADLFSKYFDNAPIYVIKGRTFPVDIFHANSLDPKSSDYVYNAMVCVKDVHLSEQLCDDILVFLTGREEIEMAVKKIRELNNELESKLYPVPLYAALSSAGQMKAFEPPPEGCRKVVIATNIAETSLTIPGIRVVIDSGKIKCRSFTAQDRVDILKVQDVSQAQAIQRAGRAGRESPGKCYRLYPESYFQKLPESSVPEILRSNLAAVVLELLEMGLKKPRKLKLIESPSDDCLSAAERELVALGAIEVQNKGSLKLTQQGHLISRFPLDPDHAKVLIFASELGCLEETLSVVAAMSTESLFDQDSNADYEDIKMARNKFSTNEGDHITALNVMQAFRNEKKKDTNKRHNLKDWCHGNFVNLKNLLTAEKIRKQLREICSDAKMKITSCGANRDKIRQALACGLFLNTCEYVRQDDRYRLLCQPRTTLKIHPSSILARSRPSYIVFTDIVRTSDLYARNVSLIDEEWVRPVIEKYKTTIRS